MTAMPSQTVMDAFRLRGGDAKTLAMSSLAAWFARIVRFSAALMLFVILAHATIPLNESP